MIERNTSNITKNIVDYEIAIARVFEKKHRLDSAIIHARNAFTEISKTEIPNEKLEALGLLTGLFEEQHMLDSAFAYQKATLALKDQLFNSNNIRQVQLLAFNEDMRKQQEAEAARKRLSANIITALMALLLFVLVIVAIIYRNNRHRKKAYALLQQQKNETDQQKLKAESALQRLKATQSQLIQSEKMASLGELTAGIAHEIQNPLNFVNNFSEVSNELIEEMKDEFRKGETEEGFAIADDIKQNLEKILHHGKRADAIVKGMLQHSQSSSGIKEPTNINALADEYLRLSYHGLRAKDNTFNATLKTDFDETIGNINIIPQDIGRVLLNLINNAFYAVNEKKKQQSENYVPTVSVSTKKVTDKIEIKVGDNGNGIPQKIADKIFQPFFTTKPTGQGTGLGLSLAYDIVKAHGGEIKINTKEGEGTEFIIQLVEIPAI